MPPSSIADNGYRYYDESVALRLQQILFSRELDLRLDEVRAILDSPDFDVESALRGHRETLRNRVGRPNHLIATVDKTITYLRGQKMMSANELFEGFNDETQARYEQEAAEMYDPKIVGEASRRWKNYSADERSCIMAEGGEVYRDLLALIDRDPADAEVQATIGRWHRNLRDFYEPTADILRGPGQGYEENPEFAAFYEVMHPGMPGFLHRAIDCCVDKLTS